MIMDTVVAVITIISAQTITVTPSCRCCYEYDDVCYHPPHNTNNIEDQQTMSQAVASEDNETQSLQQLMLIVCDCTTNTFVYKNKNIKFLRKRLFELYERDNIF